jgi:hypothetical protein
MNPVRRARAVVDRTVVPREAGSVEAGTRDEDSAERVVLSVSRSEALLLADGLRSMEYWDYATELDLPRRNGQVFLPEDDGSWWGEVVEGSDEENAIEQIRLLRGLAARVELQVGGA